MSRPCLFLGQNRFQIAIKGNFLGEESFNNQFISETVGSLNFEQVSDEFDKKVIC